MSRRLFLDKPAPTKATGPRERLTPHPSTGNFALAASAGRHSNMGALEGKQAMKMRRFEVGHEGVPNLPGMMLVTIEALRQLSGSAAIQELSDKIIEIEGVTEDEQAFIMKGYENRTRLNYYLAWARTYLKRGNAIENPSRGIWSLTKIGSTIMTTQEVQAIYDQVIAEEADKIRTRRKAKQAVATLSGSVDTSQVPFSDEDDWKAALLDVVGKMSSDAFERLSQRILREAGFTKVDVRGKSGDGGIDGVGLLRVNLVSFQIYFQCKRWKGSIPPKEIREFRGALQGGADKGLFITTGTFTSQASDEATRSGAIAIDLIDGDSLCDLLKEHGLGVKTGMIEQVTIEPEWFDSI